MDEKPVHDIFQRGLKRGAERLPFDPVKRYFYVEHPIEGWRVYLRAGCFIHEKPTGDECIDPTRFLVVKRAGQPANQAAWEPPKGQMEGKDGLRNPKQGMLSILKENLMREIGEESRVKTVSALEHTGLVLEGRESDYPPNHFFQYHIFRAMVSEKEWMRASAELDWYKEHPAAFARLKRDKREKDAIAWYSPSDTKLMGKWSPRIVAMYLKKYAT